uniref:Uncharacterized protein n=1 Tax=Anguilla anguilla TaxID=7936 RepID=A0A0E9UK56_ANGAN
MRFIYVVKAYFPSALGNFLINCNGSFQTSL